MDEKVDETKDKKYVFVCTNVDCRARGATKVLERLRQGVQDNGCAPNVEVREYMCFGACHDGPNVVVHPDKVWYAGVKEEDADRIVKEHLKGGQTVQPLTGKIDAELQGLIFQLLDSGIF